MSLYVLDQDLIFPPVEMADEDGLLAIGGDLSMDRLLLAYRNGIFPWYESKYILWWCPDPRFVLFPGELKISNSMKQVLKKGDLQFSFNRNFSGVISSCKSISRHDQEGTWITEDMRNAYINLHQHGYAQSAEAWQEGELVGGLYGLRLGNMFFGESMFSKVSNASKFAFIKFVQQLVADGVTLIDCQVYTAHLESLGARMISRKEFLHYVQLSGSSVDS